PGLTASKRTAKPARVAVSKRGESASERISSRRMRSMESASGTDSAGIQSRRSFDFATDMTISSPRSIGSILEYVSGFLRVEHQLVLVNSEVDRQTVFKVHRE